MYSSQLAFYKRLKVTSIPRGESYIYDYWGYAKLDQIRNISAIFVEEIGLHWTTMLVQAFAS